MITPWKFVAGAAASMTAVGLTAGAIYIARVDTAQIAKLAVRDITRNGDRRVMSASSRPLADEQLNAAQTLYGYYGDLDKTGKATNVSKETFSIRLSKFSPEVVGDVSGVVPYEGRKVRRTWRVQGLARDPELILNILAIASPDDPKPPTGIGTYYLARNGADYTGTAIYLDCIHKVVQCPYALARDDLSEEQVKARWPELFKKQCEKIDLTPDAPGASWTC